MTCGLWARPSRWTGCWRVIVKNEIILLWFILIYDLIHYYVHFMYYLYILYRLYEMGFGFIWDWAAAFRLRVAVCIDCHFLPVSSSPFTKYYYAEFALHMFTFCHASLHSASVWFYQHQTKLILNLQLCAICFNSESYKSSPRVEYQGKTPVNWFEMSPY